MPNDLFSMMDMPAPVANQEIERIYTTRGKNSVNWDGLISDRYSGLLIGGKIHWIDATFATYTELSSILSPLGVFVCGDGVWGMKDSNGNTTALDKKVTKLVMSHTELFSVDSNYIARSEFAEPDLLWWKVDGLKDKYFNIVA